MSLLLLGLLVPRALAADEMTEAQARLAARSVPKSVIAAYNRCGQRLKQVECTRVPVAFDRSWTGKVQFGSISNVIEGYWHGVATLQIATKGRVTVPHTDSWGTMISKVGTINDLTVRPWVTVSVSAFGKDSLHKAITGKVTLEVTYPERESPGFRNSTATRARNITFFVVSPKELVALDRLAPKDSGPPVWRILGWTAMVGLVIALLAAARRGVRRHWHGHPLPH